MVLDIYNIFFGCIEASEMSEKQIRHPENTHVSQGVKGSYSLSLNSWAMNLIIDSGERWDSRFLIDKSFFTPQKFFTPFLMIQNRNILWLQKSIL